LLCTSISKEITKSKMKNKTKHIKELQSKL